MRYIESLRDIDPVTLLKERKLETLFQNNQVLNSLDLTQRYLHSISAPFSSSSSFSKAQTLGYKPLQIMDARFSHLALPSQLHELPRNYSQL